MLPSSMSRLIYSQNRIDSTRPIRISLAWEYPIGRPAKSIEIIRLGLTLGSECASLPPNRYLLPDGYKNRFNIWYCALAQGQLA